MPMSEGQCKARAWWCAVQEETTLATGKPQRVPKKASSPRSILLSAFPLFSLDSSSRAIVMATDVYLHHWPRLAG